MRREPWFVPWSGRVNPWVVDAILAFTVAMGSVFVITGVHFERYHVVDGVAYLLVALIDLPLLLRRRLPLCVLAFSALAYAGYLALGYQPTALLWAPVLAFYTVAALRRGPAVAVGAAILVAVLLYSQVRDLAFTVPIAITGSVVIVGIAWVFGVATRKLAERNEQLAEATAALRREQQDRTERAVTGERLRIARELHDVVAHHMSVISVQSSLADYVFDSDPATARTALRTVAGSVREALEEMRRLLAVLRVGAEPREGNGSTATGLHDLDLLADRVRAAGLPTEISVVGDPRPLPPGVELCAYRVVQEALTNVLKHAGPCRARVLVRYYENWLIASVSDDGVGRSMPSRGGHGLAGMRERARLYGGTVTAGPGPAGGFEVKLTLPITGRALTGEQ